MAQGNKKPESSLRIGGVQGALWRGEDRELEGGKTVPSYSISFSKQYQKDGTWKDTNTFFLKDALFGIAIMAILTMDMIRAGASTNDGDSDKN